MNSEHLLQQYSLTSWFHFHRQDVTSYINQTCPFILLLNYMYNKLTLFPTFFFQTPTCKLHEHSSFQYQVDFELHVHVQKPSATFSLSLQTPTCKLQESPSLSPSLNTLGTPRQYLWLGSLASSFVQHMYGLLRCGGVAPMISQPVVQQEEVGRSISSSGCHPPLLQWML